MGKFTNLNRIKKQAKFTETLADRVNDDVGKHCEELKTHCYYQLPTGTQITQTKALSKMKVMIVLPPERSVK